jgi:glyoxylase-like metal-dependent hydrolase (beta-lactamase superfamily II)
MQIVKGIEIFGGIEQEPNIYVVDGELVVDCGTGFLFSDVRKSIESKYEVYKIKQIVNTHGHFDHIGGTKKFRDWLKADVCAHANDRQMFESGSSNLAEFFNEVPRIVTIDRFLRDGSTVKTTNFSFTVVHTPGHTPGSICLYEPEKRILISGDTLFDDSIGRFDLPGGDKDKMFASLNKLLDCNIQYLLPGHGPPKIGGFSFHVKQMIAHFGENRFINYNYY